MKIFISWSGETSHKVAVILRDWLRRLLPYVETWVSSTDIPKGSRWATELSRELDATNCGIVCIVPGNSDEPWLNFEAGALSKSVATARVYPFLHGLTASKLRGPLSQFQVTESTKQEVRKLVVSINQLSENKIQDNTLDQYFEVHWPQLESSLHSINVQWKIRSN